jgi:hypothetical protein
VADLGVMGREEEGTEGWESGPCDQLILPVCTTGSWKNASWQDA